MPRLIDANEAQEFFEETAKCYIPAHSAYEAGKADAYTVAADYISDCKTVDAEPVMTADEMFRKLGYVKVEPNSDEYARYWNVRKHARVEIYLGGSCCVKVYGVPVFATKGEVLACAQLIKEMEGEQ